VNNAIIIPAWNGREELRHPRLQLIQRI